MLEDGSLIPTKSVVLTTGSLCFYDSYVFSAYSLTEGTFLSAVIHLGEERTEAGRYGDAASKVLARRGDTIEFLNSSLKGLSGTLRRMNFELGRLKTGTPPRLNAHSIDYSTLTEQPGTEMAICWCH